MLLQIWLCFGFLGTPIICWFSSLKNCRRRRRRRSWEIWILCFFLVYGKHFSGFHLSGKRVKTKWKLRQAAATWLFIQLAPFLIAENEKRDWKYAVSAGNFDVNEQAKHCKPWRWQERVCFLAQAAYVSPEVTAVSHMHRCEYPGPGIRIHSCWFGRSYVSLSTINASTPRDFWFLYPLSQQPFVESHYSPRRPSSSFVAVIEVVTGDLYYSDLL